jgi:general secretion pathway protein F
MRFQYQALQRDGRLVSGLIEAVSERGAHRDLLKRGVQPTAIAPAVARTGLARRARRLGRREYGMALKQLQALIAGGVPVAEAIATLGDATDHPGLAEAYAQLTTALRRGDAFPPAFARSFPAIPLHIHRLIEAGDLSGRLAEAVGDAAGELEREAKIRSELRQALVYPAFLVGFGLLAVLFIFLVVVPRFAVTFKGRLNTLPLLSSIVINTGMWFHDHIVLTFAFLGGIALAIGWGLSRPHARTALWDLAARAPLLRQWSADVEVARWAGILARLLENRVPLIQSLELARTPLRRRDIQLLLGRVERDVRAGTALFAALHDSAFLAPAALAMIRVGERSGRLPEMVRSLAALYDESVRNRTRTVLAIVEPVAIVIIGAFVGLVAVAIFQAITSINNVPGL